MNFIHGYAPRTEDPPMINMDLVARLRPVRNGQGKFSAYDCYTVHDEMIGRIADYVVPAFSPTVVADMTGTVLVSFIEDEKGVIVDVERRPVIAWFISPPDGAEPITCELLPEVWCLELRTEPGCYIFPENRTCLNLESAKDYAAELTTYRWGKKKSTTNEPQGVRIEEKS